MFKHLHVDDEQNSMMAKMVDESHSMTDSDASSDVSPIRKVLKKKIEKGIAHSISLLKSEQRQNKYQEFQEQLNMSNRENKIKSYIRPKTPYRKSDGVELPLTLAAIKETRAKLMSLITDG